MRAFSFSKPVIPCLFLLLALAVQGCREAPPSRPEPETAAPEAVADTGGMVPLTPEDYPRFSDDMDYAGLVQAIGRSLAYLEKLPEDRLFTFGKDRFSRNHLIASLEQFRSFIKSNPSSDTLNRFLSAHYRIYRSEGAGEEGQVLFTGYYEPFLSGSRVPTETYAYPIYGRPVDLVSVDLSLFSDTYQGQRIVGRLESNALVPYHDRRAIDFGGVLDEKAAPIAWVADPVDLFFLHIQGSGKIGLGDGSVLNVHYDTSNGRPYRSIGKALIESGKISREAMSMQAIRTYLAEHPEEAPDIFGSNPSYIFFKIEDDGPLGCLGEVLTAERSLAVDKGLFPMAALSFIETSKPVIDEDGAIQGWDTCRRFMLNQDTGGAITGAGRADIFWGSGPYAEVAAGHLKHEGLLFFLVLAPGDDLAIPKAATD